MAAWSSPPHLLPCAARTTNPVMDIDVLWNRVVPLEACCSPPLPSPCFATPTNLHHMLPKRVVPLDSNSWVVVAEESLSSRSAMDHHPNHHPSLLLVYILLRLPNRRSRQAFSLTRETLARWGPWFVWIAENDRLWG